VFIIWLGMIPAHCGLLDELSGAGIGVSLTVAGSAGCHHA